MRAAQLVERDRIIAVGQLEDQAAALGAADRLDRHARGMGAGEEGEQAMIADRGDIDALVLGEIAGMAERRRAVDQRADIAGERHFGERDREAAVGDVVAGGDRAAGDRGADELAGGPLLVQVDRRRRAGVRPSRPWISRSQSDWPRWPCRSPIVTMTSPTP